MARRKIVGADALVGDLLLTSLRNRTRAEVFMSETLNPYDLVVLVALVVMTFWGE